MAGDFAAGRALFNAITSHIKEGTGLVVRTGSGCPEKESGYLILYYLFTLYDQVISQSPGIPLSLKTGESEP